MLKANAGALGMVLFLTLVSTAVAGRPIVEQDGENESFPLPKGVSLLQTAPPAAGPLVSAPPTAKEEADWVATRGKILSDFGNRITPEFQIPARLRDRTAFWFEIYTRYGEAHHVVHHGRFPWIVFTVVDTTETLANGRGPMWLRRKHAGDVAKKKAREIRDALNRLARKKDYDNLSALEQSLLQKLADVPGSRKKVLQAAAANVRTQLGQKDFFENGLISSSRYLPFMEEDFRGHDLPTELTRLPFVESSFNEAARSKVGASGIWQIMPATGRAYMIVNDQIDERNSPLKATRAAALILRSYFRAMGSWPLAITSYNNGIGNTKKAIRSVGTRDLALIIERYHRGDFRFASSNFFTCFLAALYAEKYHELIFKRVPREPLLEHEIVHLPSPTGIHAFTVKAGVSREDILKYNPDLRTALRQNATLPKGLKVFLPPGLKARLSRPMTKDQRA